jgi:hypothetical protein
MGNRGRSAWLITWEGSDTTARERCKVVAVLQPQLGEKSIRLLLHGLFCSEYPLTLCEKLFFGTAKGDRTLNYFIELHRDINQAFAYGHYPKCYLYARRVKQLRCDESPENAWKCTLRWIELPKFAHEFLDPAAPFPTELHQLIKMVRDETEETYTYAPHHFKAGIQSL